MKIKQNILEALQNYDGKPITLMEVCGSHTAALAKYGIRSLLSPRIRLVSGPGCPVCVTDVSYIDTLCQSALEEDVYIVSFGDMLKVPGTKGSLSDYKGLGAKIKMIYSPFQVIDYGKKEPTKKFIVAAVGFETTTPLYALLVEMLEKEGLTNVKLLTALKRMPPILEALCAVENQIDGFIAPGHVAAIIGNQGFETVCQVVGKPFAVAGFDAEEMILSLYDLVGQVKEGRSEVHNLYPYIVSSEGNLIAQQKIEKIFERGTASWRGLGLIEQSGYYLKPQYKQWDAGSVLGEGKREENTLCRCHDVISGKSSPKQCIAFEKSCTPMNPKGPCMVSAEGVCGIWYREGVEDDN